MASWTLFKCTTKIKKQVISFFYIVFVLSLFLVSFQLEGKNDVVQHGVLKTHDFSTKKKICNRILSDTHFYIYNCSCVPKQWKTAAWTHGFVSIISIMVYTRSPPSQQQYSANQLLRSSIVSTKGLLNGPGQNNCFLNCAVQVRFLLLFYQSLTLFLYTLFALLVLALLFFLIFNYKLNKNLVFKLEI